jgi:uncharacterized membrane protein
MLPIGVWKAHSHQVRAHRAFMTGIFLGALLIAGLFTLVPDHAQGRFRHLESAIFRSPETFPWSDRKSL